MYIELTRKIISYREITYVYGQGSRDSYISDSYN